MLQLVKKIVPEPFSPLIGGSSPWWSDALATTGFIPLLQ
jgi:hypothetical protein